MQDQVAGVTQSSIAPPKPKWLIIQVVVFILGAWDFVSKVIHYPFDDDWMDLTIFAAELAVIILGIAEIVAFTTKRQWAKKIERVYFIFGIILIVAAVAYTAFWMTLLLNINFG